MEYVIEQEAKKALDNHLQKARQQRHSQVRSQSSQWSETQRRRFEQEKQRQAKLMTEAITLEAEQHARMRIEQLLLQHDLALEEVGAAHRAAQHLKEQDKLRELKRLQNQRLAHERGIAALHKQRQTLESKSSTRIEAQKRRDEVRKEEDRKVKERLVQSAISIGSRQPLSNIDNDQNKPQISRQQSKPSWKPPAAAPHRTPVKSSRNLKQAASVAPSKNKIGTPTKKTATLVKHPGGAFNKAVKTKSMQRTQAALQSKPPSGWKPQHTKQVKPSSAAGSQTSPARQHQHPNVRHFDASIPGPENEYVAPAGLAEKHLPSGSPDAWERAQITARQEMEHIHERVKKQEEMLKRASARGQRALNKALLEKEIRATRNSIFGPHPPNAQQGIGTGNQIALLGLSDEDEDDDDEEDELRDAGAAGSHPPVRISRGSIDEFSEMSGSSELDIHSTRSFLASAEAHLERLSEAAHLAEQRIRAASERGQNHDHSHQGNRNQNHSERLNEDAHRADQRVRAASERGQQNKSQQEGDKSKNAADNTPRDTAGRNRLSTGEIGGKKSSSRNMKCVESCGSGIGKSDKSKKPAQESAKKDPEESMDQSEFSEMSDSDDEQEIGYSSKGVAKAPSAVKLREKASKHRKNPPRPPTEQSAPPTDHAKYADKYLKTASAKERDETPGTTGTSKHPPEKGTDYGDETAGTKHPKGKDYYGDETAGTSKHPPAKGNNYGDETAGTTGTSKHPPAKGKDYGDETAGTKHPKGKDYYGDETAGTTGTSKRPAKEKDYGDETAGSSKHPPAKGKDYLDTGGVKGKHGKQGQKSLPKIQDGTPVARKEAKGFNRKLHESSNAADADVSSTSTAADSRTMTSSSAHSGLMTPDGPFTSTPEGDLQLKVKPKKPCRRPPPAQHSQGQGVMSVKARKDRVLDHYVQEMLSRKRTSIDNLPVSSSSSSDLKIDSSENSISTLTQCTSTDNISPGQTPTSNSSKGTSSGSSSAKSTSTSKTWQTILEERTLVSTTSNTDRGTSPISGSVVSSGNNLSSSGQTSGSANNQSSSSGTGQTDTSGTTGTSRSTVAKVVVSTMFERMSSSLVHQPWQSESGNSTGGGNISSSPSSAKKGLDGKQKAQKQAIENLKTSIERLIKDAGEESVNSPTGGSDPTRDNLDASVFDFSNRDLSLEIQAIRSRGGEPAVGEIGDRVDPATSRGSRSARRNRPGTASSTGTNSSGSGPEKETKRQISNMSENIGDTSQLSLKNATISQVELVTSVFEELKREWANILPIERPPWLNN